MALVTPRRGNKEAKKAEINEKVDAAKEALHDALNEANDTLVAAQDVARQAKAGLEAATTPAAKKKAETAVTKADDTVAEAQETLTSAEAALK